MNLTLLSILPIKLLCVGFHKTNIYQENAKTIEIMISSRDECSKGNSFAFDMQQFCMSNQGIYRGHHLTLLNQKTVTYY